MTDILQVCFALVGTAFILAFIQWRSDPLRSIPTIGFSAPVLSYFSAFKFIRNARQVLQEGYDKYAVFKVAMLDRWIVVVSGVKMNEELRKIPDELMSFIDAADDLVQTKYTIAPDVLTHPLHIIAIREQLTRNLAPLFPEVVEEVNIAFRELTRAKGNEWVHIDAYPSVCHIVSRASSRVFVGFPLCQNKDYLKIATEYSVEVFKGTMVLSVLPNFLKLIIGPLLPWSRRAIRRASPFLTPLIEERRRKLEENGEDWPDKPNNLLTWMIEGAKQDGSEVSTDIMVQCIMASNFTAIHTSSLTFTHALYHLAANPEYIQPLREEIEHVIEQDGWTKISMGRMWKLDSFLKESQRVNGVSGISVMRKSLKDLTLSDGTFIPTGTIVVAAATATHLDEDNYSQPEVFDPFRFSDIRANETEKNKHHYVSTSADCLGFGHGKHACPGRFFAANELKIMLACIVLNYDVKFEDGSKRPENMWLATSILPAPGVKVMFRKRQDAEKQD